MIDLYTSSTPNGWKVSIMLEETKIPYQVKPIQLDQLEQKKDDYLKINPNGRIPTIIDRDEDDFAVFESGAILIYLAEKTGQFLPSDKKKRSQVLQWLMFQMGGVGPMQGQAHVFYRYAPEKIEYAIKRYQQETLRLYNVLNTQLEKYEFLAGEYSIADMATWPWVRGYEWAGLTIDDLPHLQRWIQTLEDRPACQKGLQVPEKIDLERIEQEKTLKQKGSKILI